MSFPELLAFTDECEAIDATLARARQDDWVRPGLGEWSLAELVAHLVRGAGRIDAYLDEAGVADAPEHDRVGYFRYDHMAEAAAIAERARREAAQIPVADLPARFRAAWEASARRAAQLPPGHLIPTLRGTMRLDEYTATRVLEMVVHHMDLARALAVPPGATPRAGRIAMALLEGLLGSRRPRNMGRTRFLLAATGRTPVDDPRFPVLQ